MGGIDRLGWVLDDKDVGNFWDGYGLVGVCCCFILLLVFRAREILGDRQRAGLDSLV